MATMLVFMGLFLISIEVLMARGRMIPPLRFLNRKICDPHAARQSENLTISDRVIQLSGNLGQRCLAFTQMKRALCLLWLMTAAGRLAAQSTNETVQNRSLTTTDGVRIHCIEKGTGPAMLFVPGWTMPAEIWEPQIMHFAKNHRVVAMDPRCQGRSSQTTNGLSAAGRGRDIQAVIDQFQLSPVILVGWSMGVPEIAAYVDEFGSSALASVVLVDGVAGMQLPAGTAPEDLGMIKSLRKDRQQFTEKFVRGMYAQPHSETYYKGITAASLRTPTEAAAALMISMCKIDQRPSLNKIDKPTLIVVSTIPKPTYSDMQTRIKGSRVEVIEKAGHALFVDQPEKFNTLLEDFLKANQK